MEIRLPNYEACTKVFLKIPDENRKVKEWAYFGEKLKKFTLDGFKMGALKIATMQAGENVGKEAVARPTSTFIIRG